MGAPDACGLVQARPKPARHATDASRLVERFFFRDGSRTGELVEESCAVALKLDFPYAVHREQLVETRGT